MEITKEYSRAYVEVLEVLSFLKEEEYKRVPKERIDLYNKYKDNEYIFKLDIKKGLDEQLSIKAKAVLANLFIRYIANSDDKREILVKERKKYYEEELAKSQNANLNVPLFEKKNKTTNIEESQSLIVYNEGNFFKKLIKRIKSLFESRRHNLWK